MTKMTHEEIIAKEREIWIRSCPATLDYLRDSKTDEMQATQRSLKMQVRTLIMAAKTAK